MYGIKVILNTFSVLILILMEYTLWVSAEFTKDGKTTRLNPYSNGIYSVRDFQDVEDASFLFFQLHQDNEKNNQYSIVDIEQVLGVKHN